MSRALPAAGVDLPLVVTKVDRYWLPEGDEPIARFFARNLYLPHGLRERCRRTASRIVFGNGSSLPGRRRLTATLLAEGIESPEQGGIEVRTAVKRPAVDREYERLERQATRLCGFLDLLAPKLPSGDGPIRWILIEGYAGDERLVLLVFRGPDARPVAVLKVAGADQVPRLARERDALVTLRRSLPGELAATLPEPLGFAEQIGFSALLLAPIPGRPAYVEMQRSWQPRRHLARHFRAAADWLGRFHRATRRAGSRMGIPSLLEDLHGSALLNDADRTAIDRLRERLAGRPLYLAAGHGDFWARNLMLAEQHRASRQDGLAGVIDWEDSRPEAGPLEDLFHFPLTYGRNYPWRRYRRLGPVTAFRRTFLEENPLSREVGRYFHDYCRKADLDPRALPDLFQLYLLERIWEDGRRAAADHSPEEAREPWPEMFRLLSRADRSVFSG